MELHPLAVGLVLGAVEGATEFIPVSSTGHLILVSDILGYTGRQAAAVAVVIQVGALAAIAGIYWRTFLGALGSWRRDEESRRFLLNVVIATVPAAAVGYLAHGWIMERLFSPVTVAWALIVGGVIILAIEAWSPATRVQDYRELRPSTALWIGLAQVLALFPGTSRAGATIMGGYALGLSRRAATEFSFFLALPIMLAASGLELLDSWSLFTRDDLLVLGVSFAASFVTAWIVVHALLRFVTTHTFRPFAWYRILLGGVMLLWYLGG